MSQNQGAIEDAKGHLMAYAIEWLAEWCEQDPGPLLEGLPAGARQQLEPYRTHLAGAWSPPKPGDPLLSIFSRVKDPDKQAEAPQRYWPAERLSLEKLAYPRERDEAQPDPELWGGFRAEWNEIRGWDAGLRFEAFTHLLHKWAWAVPCSYGEPGVSLCDEFRALSALVHASGCTVEPADDFLLLGGDIPGIQKTIYTITSKGAAKGLRGRSFFIQLLGDAVMRRLLHAWALPSTNVIYAAGGNFMLLAPALESSEKTLSTIDAQINRTLLDTYEGDIALCLAGIVLPAEAVGKPEFGTKYSLELKQALARQKARRFASIANANNGWLAVFEPQGGGGERTHFCAVCQAELSVDELADPNLVLLDVAELEPAEMASRACYDCATFRNLAEAIGRPYQALYLLRGKGQGERWQELLYELSDGWWYRFGDRDRSAEAGEAKLILNRANFVSLGAHGFLFLANTTPRVTPEDVAWWNAEYPDQKNGIGVGQIRSFELLARAARRDGALGRVGVLRMDVDDLGRVMTRGLVYGDEPHRSMAATSALSSALDRFFAGNLDLLCREVTAEPRMACLQGHKDEDLLYVIYAGGDDLFVVGSWHLLPLLARRVRDAFEQYVGGNPSLHISAGITLEAAKFPLYQAATRAEKALNGGAKIYRRVEDDATYSKNAVHLLGQTLSWGDFVDVQEQTDSLAKLIKQENVPRSLLQTLQMIYGRYRADKREARGREQGDPKLFYGPWMWRQAYHLKRFVQGKPGSVVREVDALQEWTLQPRRIQYLGLVARWAEYLTKGKEEEK